MNGEPQGEAFFREMDKLRRGPKRIEPSDIALVARKLGFPPHESLLRIQDYADLGHQRSSGIFGALTIFISFLCRAGKTKRVLEYTAVPSLLTARLADEHGINTLSYIAPDPHVATTLEPSVCR